MLRVRADCLLACNTNIFYTETPIENLVDHIKKYFAKYDVEVTRPKKRHTEIYIADKVNPMRVQIEELETVSSDEIVMFCEKEINDIYGENKYIKNKI